MSGKRWKWFNGFGLLEVDIVTGRPLMGDDSNEPKTPKTHFTSVFENVVAPDGTKIRNRADAEAHMRHTGMTYELDSLREQQSKENSRANDPNKARRDSMERKAEINDAIERASSSGYHRERHYHE